MSTTPHVLWSIAAGAREIKVAEPTLVSRLAYLKIDPVAFMAAGNQLRPLYDKAALDAARKPFDRARSILRNIPDADVLAAQDCLDAIDMPTAEASS